MLFISTTDLMGPDWKFLEPIGTDPSTSWQTVSGVPRGPLERAIRRPAIARWRAACEAAMAARRAAGPRLLVSHLPLMAAATNLLRRTICPDVGQVGFSFNFTELPDGPRRAFLARALRGIDEFVVYSRFERSLYASTFDLPEDRIRYLPWAMGAPRIGTETPVPPQVAAQGYVSAVGGEGRDYALLARVMRRLPRLHLVIVARPYTVAGIDFPDNVTVHTNLPADATWRIAADSRAVIIPLRSASTACGHITIVGAQLLGLPLVVTRSLGVSDYVDDEVAHTVAPGDDDQMLAAIAAIMDDPAGAALKADAARHRSEAGNDQSHWLAYFHGLARRQEASPASA